MLVAGFGDARVGQVHAQAGAEQRLLDVVRGQGVAGEQLVDVAAANQLAQRGAAAGVDDRRPADEQRLAAARGDWSTRSRAISRTSAPLGFSVETPLDMNVKSLRTAARSTGNTRTPAWPTTIGMPRRTSVIGMQRATADGVGRRVSRAGYCSFDHDAAVHLLVGDFDPVAVQADFGPLVGRAVKAFGKGAVHVGRRRAGSPASWSARRRGRRSGPGFVAAAPTWRRGLRSGRSSDRGGPGRS